MRKLITSLAAIAILAFTAHLAVAAEAPRPDTVQIASAGNPWYGEWSGRWDGQLHSRLIVEQIVGSTPTGYYCWAPGANFSGGCIPFPEGTQMKGSSLVFNAAGAKFTFTLAGSTVTGTREASGGNSGVTMTK